MSNLESTTLQEQCSELLEPLWARARQGDATAINPTQEGAAMLAALAAQYSEIPLTDWESDVMYLIPQERWPDGLADKLASLL